MKFSTVLGAASLLCALAASAAAQDCVPAYAHYVDTANTVAGSGVSGAATNAIGNTSSNYRLGDGGQLTVGFAAAFSNSGNTSSDLYINEKDDNECYWVCLFPANAATASALASAGWTAFNVGGTTVYQIPGTICGDENIDIDAYAPGYTAGALVFTKVMIEDDNNGSSGCEIIKIRAEFVCGPPTPPNCVDGFATTVVAAHTSVGGSQDGTPSSNALGDTPSTKYNLGNGGQLTVSFAGDFSNSGDFHSDFMIEEHNADECYWICVFPADPATGAALAAAGWTAFSGGTIYQLPGLFCGTQAVDVDQLVPGAAPGALKFTKLMIEDDNNGGNGVEIKRLKVELICTPPPPPPSNCLPGFADFVIGYKPGSNASGSASSALGDTPNTHVTIGDRGDIDLGFNAPFSTSGDSQVDLFVDEVGTADCYYVRLYAGDGYTAGVLNGLQPSNYGTYYDVATQYCGDANIDLDAIFGYAPNLRFSGVRITDSGAANTSNGTELARVKAFYICGVGPDCAPAYATFVETATQGATPNSGFPNSGDALGNTPLTGYSLGVGGSLGVCFPNLFTTSGGSTPEIFVDEYNVPDCYGVGVRPANAATTAALLAAGLTPFTGGYYLLPQLFCGDEDVDLDAFVPGHAAGTLYFDCVLLVDDGSSGDGSEILRVRVETACLVAILKGRVGADPNCDGVFQPGEVAIPGVQVELLDATGTTVLQTTMTGADGSYEFTTAPGTYKVRVLIDPQAFSFSAKGQGGDPTKDSDVDATGTTDPIQVSAGQTKANVDALLCFPCTGVTAYAQNGLIACDDPGSPLLTVNMPVIGQTFTATITSIYPNAVIFFLFSAGPPQPWVFPGSTCTIYLDLSTTVLFFLEETDANGTWTRSVDIPPWAGLAGAELTIQARLCAPWAPSPIPGLTDWPTSASYIRIGCL